MAIAAPIAAITKRATNFSGIPPIGLIQAPGSSMKSAPSHAGWTRMNADMAVMIRNPLKIVRMVRFSGRERSWSRRVRK
ncbi:hypothetical protein DSECCO2_580670 [anaerobic digester metagenome]